MNLPTLTAADRNLLSRECGKQKARRFDSDVLHSAFGAFLPKPAHDFAQVLADIREADAYEAAIDRRREIEAEEPACEREDARREERFGSDE